VIGFDFIVQSDIVTARTHAKLMRELNREVMERHAAENLPKHFANVPETFPGAGGYRYRRRQEKYNQMKRRRFGEAIPNVKTGALREAVLAKVKVTATQHRARILTSGTREHQLTDWQRREIEIRSEREKREDIKWQEQEYSRRVQLPENRRKRRRKLG
jgi:D-tyrosyl-tRNA(Tyr) deacylase